MPKVSIAIDVGNRQQAETFYVDALGCDHLRDPYPNMTLVSAGGVEIWLTERPAGTDPLPGGGSTRSYERHWTPIHLDFRVDDIEATLRRVADNHGTCEREGETEGEGGYRWAFCADPFGNGFCLMQYK